MLAWPFSSSARPACRSRFPGPCPRRCRYAQRAGRDAASHGAEVARHAHGEVGHQHERAGKLHEVALYAGLLVVIWLIGVAETFPAKLITLVEPLYAGAPDPVLTHDDTGDAGISPNVTLLGAMSTSPR